MCERYDLQVNIIIQSDRPLFVFHESVIIILLYVPFYNFVSSCDTLTSTEN